MFAWETPFTSFSLSMAGSGQMLQHLLTCGHVGGVTESPIVPEQLRTVAQALVDGRDQTEAAGLAGVSPRHFRRLLTELMVLVGVETPYQAIAVCVDRGWVRPKVPRRRV